MGVLHPDLATNGLISLRTAAPILGTPPTPRDSLCRLPPSTDVAATQFTLVVTFQTAKAAMATAGE
jgi:hypothetical protein